MSFSHHINLFHSWSLLVSVSGFVCVCLCLCGIHVCVHKQSSNPVFTVTPEQLMSSAGALLVSEACVNMCVRVCVCTLPLLE